MTERDMMHGTDWQGQNPRGWFVSEKLDGCRCYWSGAALWTRSGHSIAVPDSITRGLPPWPLDGELWCGRGGFTRARLAVQFGKWTPAVRFVCFDAPQHPGAWPDRIEAARAAGVPAVSWWTCGGMAELSRDLDRIVRAGGEGLMLRDPSARGYRPGRSRYLLKLKPGNSFVHLLFEQMEVVR
jgi:DNA ligase-1